MFKNTFIVLVVAALLIVLVVAGPILVLWAGNEIGQYLWPDRTVPYTIWTWLAVLIIGVFIRGDLKITKKS
jgi:uncharacterized BrkB/YihY/UPF0761 family membrane protein